MKVCTPRALCARLAREPGAINARNAKSKELELAKSLECGEEVAHGKTGLGTGRAAFCDGRGVRAGGMRYLATADAAAARQGRRHDLAASMNDVRAFAQHQLQIQRHQPDEENEKDMSAASEYVLDTVLP
ncbi:hypothetical protein BBJ28_00007957 [Nothophytophthora sp. Chile5]|nr:hypothetical protein BBJ28_00007957 [Nothophytophthora sp. Chile5]